MNTSFEKYTTVPLVLVVDDDEGMRKVLRCQMEHQGYRVIEAEDGRQALFQYTTYHPDVVLLDALMPIMDGFTCCRRLMILEKRRTPIVLMTTTLTDPKSINQAFDVGATDFVSKPINWTILHQRMRRLIKQAEMVKRLQEYNNDLENHAQSSNLTIRQRTAQLYKALELESVLKRITDQVRDTLEESQILQTAIQELTGTLNLQACKARIDDGEYPTGQSLYEYYSSATETVVNFDFSGADQCLINQDSVPACAFSPYWTPDQIAVFSCSLRNGHRIGDLWLFAEGDRVLDDLEMRLVEQVANQCAIGIRQARLYQAAQMQVQELERLHELKDDFLSTVSHELRSPLATMRMAIQLLEQSLEQGRFKCGQTAIENRDYTKIVTYVNILTNECEREIALINDLLNLQKLDAGEYALTPVTIRLQDWIPTEIACFILRAQDRQQIVQVDLANDLPSLNCDPLCLQRIVTELLNNAYKYSPPGASITLIATAEANWVQLTVINTGVEIPESELPKVFDRFYRVTGADRWKQGGTGLGLALVKRLVTLLGGSISASSSDEQVYFLVKLPVSSFNLSGDSR